VKTNRDTFSEKVALRQYCPKPLFGGDFDASRIQEIHVIALAVMHR
jgi:hypothetical protein